MQIQFFFMGVIGLFFLIVGLKWTIASFYKKDIIRFNIREKKKTFYIARDGFYSACILGGGFADGSNGFNIVIEDLKTGVKTSLPEDKVKTTFHKDGKLAVEYAQFIVYEIGDYSVEIENFEQLVVKDSMLWTQRIFQKKHSSDSIEILIKESLSSTKQILSVLFLVGGGNMAVFGFIKAFS